MPHLLYVLTTVCEPAKRLCPDPEPAIPCVSRWLIPSLRVKTKTRLGNPEVRRIVEGIVTQV